MKISPDLVLNSPDLDAKLKQVCFLRLLHVNPLAIYFCL